LIRQANKVVYGDPRDNITYPGVGAAEVSGGEGGDGPVARSDPQQGVGRLQCA